MPSFTGVPATPFSRPGNVVPAFAPAAAGAITARRCHFPASSWVYAFILTCDDKLAVWFKRGRRRRRRHARTGGVPGVCCLYPTSDEALYDLAVSWWSAGHFVHQFLYKILPYQLVQPPPVPCPGCQTACAVTSSLNPSDLGDAVTFTCTVTDDGGEDTPQGTVTWFIDGSPVGTCTVSGSGNTASCTFSTSALTVGTHTVVAQFSGTQGFQGTTCGLVQTVRLCRCAGLPNVLYVTLTGALSGSYALTWDGVSTYTNTNTTYCPGGGPPAWAISLACNTGTWHLSIGAFGANGSGPCSPLSLSFTVMTSCGSVGATVTT